MNKLITGLVASSCLLGVVACDSDDDDDDRETPVTPAMVTQWGLLDIDTEDEVEIGALFGRFETGLSVAAFQEELIPGLDECEVDIVPVAEEGDGDDDLDIEFSVDYDLISAGDSISINSPGGSYATLFRDTEANLYSVESGATIAAPVPGTLSAIISGDVFPAFAIVAIPDVLDLEFSSPADGEIVTAATIFRWNQSGVSNSYVSLSAAYEDDESNEVSVECTVIDDGEFTLPLSVQQELGAEFAADEADLSRTSYSFTTENGATLAIRNTVDI